MNKVLIMGRLTKEPDIYDAVTRFRIAVNRKFKTKDGQTADFFNCACFGKTKDIADIHLSKGTKIIVEGRLQSGKALSVDGTNSIEKVDIIAESIEFAESKKQEEEATPRVGFADADIEGVPFA